MKTDMDYKENQGSATWSTSILAAYSPHFKILEQYCAFIIDSFFTRDKTINDKILTRIKKKQLTRLHTRKNPFINFFLQVHNKPSSWNKTFQE